MIPYYSKSYPYLAISQHHHVDYGEVLKFADALKNGLYDKICAGEFWHIEHIWQDETVKRFEERGY